MKTYRPMISMLAMCGALLLLAGRANPMEQRSVVNVSEKIRIPGQTLDPGSYIFRMEEPRETGQAGGQTAQPQSGRRMIVRVAKDGEESNVIATCLAIANDRLTPDGDSGLLYWPASGDLPKAVRAWFSPGDNLGYEFAYSESEARDIGMAAGEQVPTLTQQDEEMIEAAATATGAQSASQHAQTEPEKDSTTKPDELPATASPLPALGLIGLMFLAAGLTFRAIRPNP